MGVNTSGLVRAAGSDTLEVRHEALKGVYKRHASPARAANTSKGSCRMGVTPSMAPVDGADESSAVAAFVRVFTNDEVWAGRL